MRTYLTRVLDVARAGNSPTWDRLAMSASATLRKLDDLEGPKAGLAEAMGFPAVTTRVAAEHVDPVALDVLQRSDASLAEHGEDCDPQTVGNGLRASDAIIKQLQHETGDGVNLGLIASAGPAPRSVVGAPFVVTEDGVTVWAHEQLGRR